jgi:antitoxin MazE
VSTAIRKMGNSSGIILPKTLLKQLSMSEGDRVELRAEGRRIIIEPVQKKIREGWAEDAKRIAEESIDTDWLEFPNEADDTLVW